MGLVSKTAPTRFEIPHEPGQWVDLRPITYDQVEKAKANNDPMAALALAVMAWSYDAPVNEENVRDLDVQTANWLAERLAEVCGVDQGEATAAVSTPTTSP